MPPLKYFPVFARVRIQAPHVFAQKLIPQEFFPACTGFVPGGTFACEKVIWGAIFRFLTFGETPKVIFSVTFQ